MRDEISWRATCARTGPRGLARLGSRVLSDYDGEPRTRPPKVVIASMQASPELVISPEPIGRERCDDTRAIPPSNAAQLHGGGLQPEQLIWASVLGELTRDLAQDHVRSSPSIFSTSKQYRSGHLRGPKPSAPHGTVHSIGKQVRWPATGGHERPWVATRGPGLTSFARAGRAGVVDQRRRSSALSARHDCYLVEWSERTMSQVRFTPVEKARLHEITREMA